MNRLYYGDCLTIMQELPLRSVDLIYLDPPFNSNREYNAIYQDETGRPLPDQIEAFCDQWTLDGERERAIRDMPVLMRMAGIDDEVASFWQHWMNALRKTNPRLLAYLSYMVERLVHMKGMLRPTGSIYLHCDPTASHYIKVMMDSIFGHDNFRNEIIWKRTSSHSGAKRYGPIHDTLLFYTRSKKWTWNATYQAYSPEYIEAFYKYRDAKGRYRISDLTGAGPREGESGQPWRDIDPSPRHWAIPRTFPGAKDMPKGTLAALDHLKAIGRIAWTEDGMPGFKRYLHEMKGVKAQSIWTDIRPASGKERVGYDTQKPLDLMRRIILSSSNPGDVVFDPFCGCASTIEAAHELGRKWIGVDIAIHAIKRVAKVRLQDRLRLVEGKDFQVEGFPRNLEGAEDLWRRDKYHFQKWAVEQVDGFVTRKRTGDGGIDGRLYFHQPGRPDLGSMVIEVKGGKNVGIGVVRELRGVLEREEAQMAGLIVMKDLGPRKTPSFEREMAAAGDLDVMGVKYPKMQMLTVEDIFDGRRFVTPSVAGLSSGQGALPITMPNVQ